MNHIGRAKLRGAKLTGNCYRARICHGDFKVNGISVDTCWGLIDPMTDDTWPECAECKAYCNNVPSAEHWADYIKEIA